MAPFLSVFVLGWMCVVCHLVFVLFLYLVCIFVLFPYKKAISRLLCLHFCNLQNSVSVNKLPKAFNKQPHKGRGHVELCEWRTFQFCVNWWNFLQNFWGRRFHVGLVVSVHTHSQFLYCGLAACKCLHQCSLCVFFSFYLTLFLFVGGWCRGGCKVSDGERSLGKRSGWRPRLPALGELQQRSCFHWKPAPPVQRGPHLCKTYTNTILLYNIIKYF